MSNEFHIGTLYGAGVTKNNTVNVGAPVDGEDTADLRVSIEDLVVRLERCAEELRTASGSPTAPPTKAGLERLAAAAASVTGIATAAETVRRTIEGLWP